jgi:hypothetical protein
MGSCVQLNTLAETPQLPPSPCIWAQIRGRYWSANIDDISLKPPGVGTTTYMIRSEIKSWVEIHFKIWLIFSILAVSHALTI